MQVKTPSRKAVLIVGLVVAITALHVFTAQEQQRVHIIYRELYFLPLILAGFWYGLRGALVASLSITAFYLPYTVYRKKGLRRAGADAPFACMRYGLFSGGLGFSEQPLELFDPDAAQEPGVAIGADDDDDECLDDIHGTAVEGKRRHVSEEKRPQIEELGEFER